VHFSRPSFSSVSSVPLTCRLLQFTVVKCDRTVRSVLGSGSIHGLPSLDSFSFWLLLTSSHPPDGREGEKREDRAVHEAYTWLHNKAS